MQIGRRVVLHVKRQQLAEDVVALLAARVSEQLPAGDDGEEQAAEDLGHLDAQPAWIFAGAFPEFGASHEVVVALDEVGGALHEHGTQPAMAATLQGAVGAIDLIALVARGHEAGSPGDGIGVEVQRDGSQLAGQVGDGDNVDAGNAQQQGVRSVHDKVSERAFQIEDFLGFVEPIVIERLKDAAATRHGGRDWAEPARPRRPACGRCRGDR